MIEIPSNFREMSPQQRRAFIDKSMRGLSIAAKQDVNTDNPPEGVILLTSVLIYCSEHGIQIEADQAEQIHAVILNYYGFTTT